MLIAGGFKAKPGGTWQTGYFEPTTEAEIYDPATGTFRLAHGSLRIARGDHSALRLPDGRVAIVGGRNNAGGLIYATEIYDPATETFSLNGNLLVSPAQYLKAMQAFLLSNGKILVAEYGYGIQGAEILDPMIGSSTVFALTSTYYGWDMFVPLANDRLLLWETQGRIQDLHDGSTTTTAVGLRRCFGYSLPLSGGKYMMLGDGACATSDIQTAGPAVDVFDDASGRFDSLYTNELSFRFPYLSDPSAFDNVALPSVVLDDGRVLITGGRAYTDSSAPEGGYKYVQLLSTP